MLLGLTTLVSVCSTYARSPTAARRQRRLACRSLLVANRISLFCWYEMPAYVCFVFFSNASSTVIKLGAIAVVQ
jgi:hypothetical protein